MPLDLRLPPNAAPPLRYMSLDRKNCSPSGLILRGGASSSNTTSSLLQKRVVRLPSPTGRVSAREDRLVATRKPQGERDLPANDATEMWCGNFS